MPLCSTATSVPGIADATSSVQEVGAYWLNQHWVDARELGARLQAQVGGLENIDILFLILRPYYAFALHVHSWAVSVHR